VADFQAEISAISATAIDQPFNRVCALGGKFLFRRRSWRHDVARRIKACAILIWAVRAVRPLADIVIDAHGAAAFRLFAHVASGRDDCTIHHSFPVDTGGSGKPGREAGGARTGLGVGGLGSRRDAESERAAPIFVTGW
jgi:hypothetical protein